MLCDHHFLLKSVGSRNRETIQELYVEIQGLIDFVEVNRTGFRKALKKHDKVSPKFLRLAATFADRCLVCGSHLFIYLA